jgi:hypothetical protein
VIHHERPQPGVERWRYVPDSGSPEANAETLREQADQAISTLEAAASGWSSLSASQKDGALKLSVRVVAKLARLVLGRLESS